MTNLEQPRDISQLVGIECNRVCSLVDVQTSRKLYRNLWRRDKEVSIAAVQEDKLDNLSGK